MPAIMLTLDLLLLSPPWTIKFQGALTLSTFLAFAYCKFIYKSAFARGGGGAVQDQSWSWGHERAKNLPLQPHRSLRTRIRSTLTDDTLGAWIEYTFSHNQT